MFICKKRNCHVTEEVCEVCFNSRKSGYSDYDACKNYNLKIYLEEEKDDIERSRVLRL